jgi:MFS family permease
MTEDINDRLIDSNPEELPITHLSLRVWRILVVLLSMSPGFFVQFHRYCTTVSAIEMAHDYDIELEQMSIFSSAYFYSFALCQPFVGLLSDLVKCRNIICIALICSSVGSLLTSFSSSLFLGVLGRIIVGISCSPLYVCTQKVAAVWFESKYFGIMNGIWNIVAGIGALTSQYPMAMLIPIIGWRWCFRSISILSVCLCCLCWKLPNSPESLGFPPIPDCGVNRSASSTIGFWRKLFENIRAILCNRRYWIAAFYFLFGFIPFNSLSALWASPYCEQILGFDSHTAGLVMFSFVIPTMIFSLGWAQLGGMFRIKQFLVIITSILAASSCIPFICTTNLSPGIVSVFFSLDAMGPSSACNLVSHWVRDVFSIELVGTCMGLVNVFWWGSGAIGQLISGWIIKSYGQDDDGKYTEKGYRVGVWWLGLISTLLSVIPAIFMKYDYNVERDSVNEELIDDDNNDISKDEELSTSLTIIRKDKTNYKR